MSQQPNPPPGPSSNETTLADVKQLGLWASIASLSYVFWVVGGMEMIERLAFYGVRAVATLYATRPESTGGLGVTMATFGTLLLCWNLVHPRSAQYGRARTKQILITSLLHAAGDHAAP
jgi:proton-dependent oligopeptide transporter, POT family